VRRHLARVARDRVLVVDTLYQGEAGDYFWGGAGGTYFWVDPKTDMFVVFMMQSPKQRVPVRAVLRNMTYGAVLK